MKRCTIARILSIMICFIYLSSPIFALNLSSKNHPTKSEQKLIFQSVKKDIPTLYDELEDSEEESDFISVYIFDSEDFFVVKSLHGEIPFDNYPKVQTNSLHVHLPLWLDVRHIIR